MDKMDYSEKVWGGIFGIVAIVAAVAEMFINGIDASSVVGAIKDIFGTLVVVVLLVAFVKSLPKKPKKLDEILEKDIEDWGTDNAPLIFKTENYVSAQNTNYEQGFVLLQNPGNYVSLSNNNLTKENPEWHKYAQYGNGKLTGKFLDFPSYKTMTETDFDALIVMEQSHFKNMPEIDSIITDIAKAINSRGNGRVHAERIGASNKIKLTCKKIETIDEERFFVDMLDFILSLVKVVV